MKATWKKIMLLLLVTLLVLPAGLIAPPAEANNNPNTVYHETFINGLDIVPAISGDTVTENVYSKVFSGNSDGAALHLKERRNSYDGLDFIYADMNLNSGETYNITITGFVDSNITVPNDSLITLQEVNPTAGEYGGWLANIPLVAGQAFTLKLTYSPDTTTYTSLRLGSNETAKAVPFYIGDVLFKIDSDEFEPVEIAKYTFEQGSLQGWGNRGQGRAASTDETSHSGDYSLKVTNRSDSWHGSEISVTNLLLNDGEYEFTGYAKLVDGQAASNVKLTMQVTDSSSNNNWITLAEAASVTDQGWVELTPTKFSVNGYTSMLLYAESNSATTEFYIDDITITMVTPPVDVIYTFEDGQQGDWVRRFGNGNIQVTNEDNTTANGQYSLKTTVTDQYDGALLSVAGLLEKGHEYRLSAKVKMAAGEQSAPFRISVQYGDSSFANVSQTTTITSQDWVTLSGLYTQSVNPGSVLNVYVEMATGVPGETRTFLVDDFRITYNKPVAGPNPDYTLQSIAEVYEDYFPIGNIMNPGDFGDPDRLAFMKKHYTLLSAENGMKPEYAYDRDGQFDFTGINQLIDNALDNDFDIHGHVLVWHSQSPEWLHTQPGTSTPLPEADALANLRTHIQTVVREVGPNVISWDVVNEAVEDSKLTTPEQWETTLRESGWWRALGPDFIYESFLAAREVIEEEGWDIDLYYNDYNDDNQRKATAIAAMVRDLNERYEEEYPDRDHKLIDGVGMQSHYNLNTNVENVRASIERFINIGVKVGVTELDVMAGNGGVQTEEQVKAQAYLYAQLFKLYKEYADHITRVTLWGIDDGTSWRSENAPLIFDNRYQAKPAYFAIIDPETYIEENPPEEKVYLQSNAKYGTPQIDGEVDSLWNTAPELPLTRYQTAHNGATGVAKALWDEDYLYVLVEVNDADLDASNAEAYQQDSVEVFVDENNAKSSSYEEDDGQYRVNFNNVASFNPASAEEGFESAVVVEDTYYRVEMKIPFKTITPTNNTKIGFDAQINDASNGERRSVAIWNDYSGSGWQDPSVFGVLTLNGKSGSGGGNVGGDAGTATPTPFKPEVKVTNGQATVTLSEEQFEQLFSQATVANGQKKITIDINLDGVTGSLIDLPKSSLDSNESYIITINTPQGTISVPSDMLSSVAGFGSQKVTLSISAFDNSQLDAAAKAQVGNRPVISLNVLVDGKVVEWNNPNTAVTVSIPYKPGFSEDEEHIVVWYIDDEGNITPIVNSRYDEVNGTVMFTTNHFSTYAVSYVVKSFSDISNVPWAKKAIEVMASRQIINGVSATNYNPSDNIKRADFIALLVRALELRGSGEVTVFNDVNKSDYFYNEVLVAKQLGIANGTGNNNLNANESITRQDAMVLVYNAMTAAGIDLYAGNLAGYADADQVSDYAKYSVASLIKSGIISGDNGKITPKATLTRAQAAVILYRIWSY